MFVDKIPRLLEGLLVVVAGTGPSLTEQVAATCSGHCIIAVNNAAMRVPHPFIAYAADLKWWDVHHAHVPVGAQRWTVTEPDTGAHAHKPLDWLEFRGVSAVNGAHAAGFSRDASRLHYGRNSGFQAVNLALLMGASRVVMVGFDMHFAYGAHFFGDHEKPLRTKTDHSAFIRYFDEAARTLQPGVRIVNANEDSALECFEKLPLECALRI